MKQVVVVGGGIAGLTTALHLKDRADKVPGGLQVTLLEAGDTCGGNIRTERTDGFTIESGPNGYLDNVQHTPALVERIGLGDSVQPSDDAAAKRFLFRRGRLHALPSGAGSFFGSSLLSFTGRLRVALEPFTRPKAKGLDETVHAFASRHMGREAADILVDSMVSGVFAGDSHQLSLQSAFPKMAAMEAEHRSLVKAMVAKARKARKAIASGDPDATKAGGPAGPGGTLTSFHGGLSEFIDRLSTTLGDTVQTEQRVHNIAHIDGKWLLRTSSDEQSPPMTADALLVAIPPSQASPLLHPTDSVLTDTLDEIPSSNISVVALAFDDDEARALTQGFGFLIPRGQGTRILGCLWDSSIFPGRAPGNKVLVRCMIGGAHDPKAIELSDDALVKIARDDMALTMGLKSEPLFHRVYRHRTGIAQYSVGHSQRLDRIHTQLEKLPGLWLAGNGYYGISMNACTEKADGQAAQMIEFLGRD